MMVSTDEYWQNEREKALQKQQINIKYARVTALTEAGHPIIRFDGETLASQKLYPMMGHVVPQVNDRVRLIDDIIDGVWRISNI